MARQTKQERRIAILKDAVAQLKAGTYQANRGGVITGTINEMVAEVVKLSHETKKLLGMDQDAKTFINNFVKTHKGKGACDVCARGALLLSTVGKENNFAFEALTDLDWGSFHQTSDVDQRLTKLFTAKQLMMMETAFEGNHNEHRLGPELYEKCIKFNEKYLYKGDRTTLLAIFNNAIKNGGIFKL